MSSALKNFSITFAIALTAFALLGFFVLAPLLIETFDFSEMGSSDVPSGDVSGDISGDASGDASGDVSTVIPNIGDTSGFDENGDVFTAVIMCVDDDGRPVNMAFIDANGKTDRYIYCSIDPQIKISNEIGVMVPLEDLFRGLSDDAITSYISTMTGIETQYCLRFTRDSLGTVSGLIPGANISLNEIIDFNNPAYKDLVLAPGEVPPDDYRITISNIDGKVLLNNKLYEKTNLQWLLSYNPNLDGSPYNALYSQIGKNLLVQFLTQEHATQSTSAMQAVLSVCKSNISTDAATQHLATIFSYNDFKLYKTTYPMKSSKVADWENAVKNLRQYDGSLDIYN